MDSRNTRAVHIYPFSLAFQDPKAYTFFPFIIGGEALDSPKALISLRSAGSMIQGPGERNGNRDTLYAALHIDRERVFACTQVHGQETLVVDSRSPPLGAEGDGLISRDARAFLSVTVADCLPVFLYDPDSGGFGLVHSGWKGTGIVLRALGLMEQRWGARAENTGAILGPCIQVCCYQVDEARASTFEAAFGGSEGAYPLGPVIRRIERKIGTSWYLDLPAANARLLANAGVRNIAVCQNCTFTDERLGSFRREGYDFTRMIALIGYDIPSS